MSTHDLKKFLCPDCLKKLASLLALFVFKRPSRKEARRASKLIAKMVNEYGAKMRLRKAVFYRKNETIIVRNFFGQVIAVISLIDWGDIGIEIVSHAVHPRYQGQGLGAELFERIKKKIQRRNPNKVFLFTAQTEFYRQLGFVETDPSQFGAKISTDCVPCQLGPNGPGFAPCPETAMIFSGNLWRKQGEHKC